MEIGNNWISTNERVAMIDTCSVDISSIRIDSVQTSGGNAVYAGCRESPYWGRTDISPYLTFKATEDYEDSSTPEYEERIIFDSLSRATDKADKGSASTQGYWLYRHFSSISFLHGTFFPLYFPDEK